MSLVHEHICSWTFCVCLFTKLNKAQTQWAFVFRRIRCSTRGWHSNTPLLSGLGRDGQNNFEPSRQEGVRGGIRQSARGGGGVSASKHRVRRYVAAFLIQFCGLSCCQMLNSWRAGAWKLLEMSGEAFYPTPSSVHWRWPSPLKLLKIIILIIKPRSESCGKRSWICLKKITTKLFIVVDFFKFMNVIMNKILVIREYFSTHCTFHFGAEAADSHINRCISAAFVHYTMCTRSVQVLVQVDEKQYGLCWNPVASFIPQTYCAVSKAVWATALPAEPYFWSKLAEHDVTLTPLATPYYS